MMQSASGTKQISMNNYINDLQQQLARSQAEVQRQKDKLSCLISLIRRSWKGDRNASIHIANIVGLDLPPSLQGSDTAGRPVSSALTPSAMATVRAVHNWEKITSKLLQRENELWQYKIQQFQHHYLHQRSCYMDDLMHFHQRDMARLPLSRSSTGKLNSIDEEFLRQHSMVNSDSQQKTRGHQQYRSKSASSLRTKQTGDGVLENEIKLRDLFIEPSQTAAQGTTTWKVKQTAVKADTCGDYDDPKRYMQDRLFAVDEVLSKKSRPMSSTVQRESDEKRARPKSAHCLASIGDCGQRPLKNETTRPVSAKKPHSAKARKFSTSSNHSQRYINSNNNQTGSRVDSNVDFVQPDAEESEEQREVAEEMAAKESLISVKVQNAIKCPESVVNFCGDLRQMQEMEEAFQKHTLALQKRLCLPENGLI